MGFFRKRKERKQAVLQNKTYVENGTKLSYKENAESASGGVRVSQVSGDIVLVAAKTYKAQKNGYLMPGKYVALSTTESDGSFNLRLGRFVREYKHGDAIVIGDGEEITAVSGTVILR